MAVSTKSISLSAALNAQKAQNEIEQAKDFRAHSQQPHTVLTSESCDRKESFVPNATQQARNKNLNLNLNSSSAHIVSSTSTGAEESQREINRMPVSKDKSRITAGELPNHHPLHKGLRTEIRTQSSGSSSGKSSLLDLRVHAPHSDRSDGQEILPWMEKPSRYSGTSSDTQHAWCDPLRSTVNQCSTFRAGL